MKIINMTGFDAYVENSEGTFDFYKVEGNLQQNIDFPKTEMVFRHPDVNQYAIVKVYNTMKEMPKRDGVVYMIPKELELAYLDRDDICIPNDVIEFKNLSKYYKSLSFINPYKGEDNFETI